MKNEAEVITRLRSYEPLWGEWKYNDRLFGSGGSGCVLGLSRGEDKSVVKVIYIEDNQQKYNAVKDEIETMVTLRSEHLVECLNYRIEEVFNRKGEKIGYDFLIHMNEYEPFSEFLREEDYDPNEICLQLARDIGEALCMLHSNGILHRDIKPENIFTDNSSGERHFRLGDFGVSKRIGDMSGLTTTGTLNFMAPESFKYYEYSYRSDIYNLGMTLYYILNDLRFPVFTEEESQSDFDYNTDCRLHGEKLPKPVYGSDELVKVVTKCCEANPKDRYKDISEMLNDLYGQNIPQMGIKLKKELPSISKRKAMRQKIIRIFLLNGIAILVAFAIVFGLNMYSNRPIDSELGKYSPDKINQYVSVFRQNMDILQNTTEITDTDDSYTINISPDNGIIVQMTDNALDNVSFSNYDYNCFFDKYGRLYYIYSEQGELSYRIYIYNNDIIRVITGGSKIETYDYGNDKITVKYQKVVDDANKVIEKVKEEYTDYFRNYDENSDIMFEE